MFPCLTGQGLPDTLNYGTIKNANKTTYSQLYFRHMHAKSCIFTCNSMLVASFELPAFTFRFVSNSVCYGSRTELQQRWLFWDAFCLLDCVRVGKALVFVFSVSVCFISLPSSGLYYVQILHAWEFCHPVFTSGAVHTFRPLSRSLCVSCVFSFLKQSCLGVTDVLFWACWIFFNWKILIHRFLAFWFFRLIISNTLTCILQCEMLSDGYVLFLLIFVLASWCKVVFPPFGESMTDQF